MATPRDRLAGTLHLTKPVREKIRMKAGLKFSLASRSRNDEQFFVKPEDRIQSMKH